MTTERFDLLSTETFNPRTVDLDRLDTLAILRRINAEDQTVAIAVEQALADVARAVDLAYECWQRGGDVVLFGAGTSGRLAALDAAELAPTFGVPRERYRARIAGGADAFATPIEGAEDDGGAGAQAAQDLRAVDVAFGIAASGRTPWVFGALEAARARGAATIGLACVARPALAASCDVTIAVDTGPEPISGSTRMKAGTAQKLILNAFSSTLMIRLGKVYSNLMVDVRATNAKLRDRAMRLVIAVTDASEADARDALAAADGHVKTAIVILKLGVSAAVARAQLAAAQDSLRAVLESART